MSSFAFAHPHLSVSLARNKLFRSASKCALFCVTALGGLPHTLSATSLGLSSPTISFAQKNLNILPSKKSRPRGLRLRPCGMKTHRMTHVSQLCRDCSFFALPLTKLLFFLKKIHCQRIPAPPLFFWLSLVFLCHESFLSLTRSPT